MFNVLKQEPQPNVYQMWFGTQPGPLWITRTTWANLCAKVTVVGQAKGPAPYYGNPAVKADCRRRLNFDPNDQDFLPEA